MFRVGFWNEMGTKTTEVSSESSSSVDMNGFVCQTAAQNIQKIGEDTRSKAKTIAGTSQENFNKVLLSLCLLEIKDYRGGWRLTIFCYETLNSISKKSKIFRSLVL